MLLEEKWPNVLDHSAEGATQEDLDFADEAINELFGDEVHDHFNPSHVKTGEHGGEFAPKDDFGGGISAEQMKQIAGRLNLTPEDIAEIKERVSRGGDVIQLRSPMAATPTPEQARGVDSKPHLGQCYDMAARYLMDHAISDRYGTAPGANLKDARLIHGTVSNPNPFTRNNLIAHAWVDLGDGKIFDGALQKFFEKDSYYKYFNAKEEQSYTHDEMMKAMAKDMHYGPWGETAGFYNKLPEKKKRTRKHEQGFDPAEHPRQPSGTEKGGEFAPKGGASPVPPELGLEARSLMNWPSGKDTLQENTLPDGTLTPERQALHDKRIAEVLKGHEPVENPVVQLMGGGGAAGKSVMQAGLAIKKGILTVDVDVERTKLPEWTAELELAKKEGRHPNVMLGTYTHEESSLISKKIIKEAVTRKLDYMVDGAGDSSIEKLRQNVKMYSNNRKNKIHANYVTVDYDEAYRRMRERGDEIGRYIPAAHLRAVHAEVSRVFPQAVKEGLFDKFALWDTTGSRPILDADGKPTGKFTPALKVASGEGTHMVVHDQEAWNRFLKKGEGIPARRGEI